MSSRCSKYKRPLNSELIDSSIYPAETGTEGLPTSVKRRKLVLAHWQLKKSTDSAVELPHDRRTIPRTYWVLTSCRRFRTSKGSGCVCYGEGV